MKKKIRDFIIENIVEDNTQFNDSDSLFEEGIIDSMGQIKLISYIQEEFDIIINPGEITIENFDTLDKITAFIIKSGSTQDN